MTRHPGPRATGEDPRAAPLARAVRTRREELGLRQSELADLAGCSQRFVHTMEHGKGTLRLDKVLDVLRVLGLGFQLVPGRGAIEPQGGEGPPRPSGDRS